MDVDTPAQARLLAPRDSVGPIAPSSATPLQDHEDKRRQRTVQQSNSQYDEEFPPLPLPQRQSNLREEPQPQLVRTNPPVAQLVDVSVAQGSSQVRRITLQPSTLSHSRQPGVQAVYVLVTEVSSTAVDIRLDP